MAFALSLFTSVSVPYLPSPRSEGHLWARSRPTHLDFPRHSPRLAISTVACARRKGTDSAASKTKKKQRPSRKERDEEDDDDDDDDEEEDDDGDDEDALEALFQELEKDLKNDTASQDGDDEDMDDDDAFEALFDKLEKDLKNDTSSLGDDDDDITEEDFVEVERALAEAFGSGSDDEEDEEEYEEDEDDDDDDDDDDDEDDDDEDDDDEDDEDGFKLKNWQFRRLASVLKAGRRKTGIKNLAAELCLDRAVVLEILRNPPPKLLMYSAILPDFKPIKPVKQVKPKVETKPVETVPAIADVEPQRKVSAPVPVHVRQTRWSAQKGLKKVHAMTLEQVYRKTKRPTNAMVSSIVHVTKLPRKKIVKWFEDKRAEDGVLDKYPTSYQRSAYETETESETDSSE